MSKLRPVRVPVPIVVALSIVTVFVTWWVGTRGRDFVTPPPGLDAGKSEVTANRIVPAPLNPEQAPTPTDPVPPVAQPALALDAYANEAVKGAAHLESLGSKLEQEGQNDRALLAWERILDSTVPTTDQASAAKEAVARLRAIVPSGQGDNQSRQAIVLHAGTAERNVEIIRPVLDEFAKTITSVSSGILAAEVVISAGSNPPEAGGPSPVALWITGPGDKTRSSDVLSLTLGHGEDPTSKLRATLNQLLESMITRTLSPPPPDDPSASLATSLGNRITRRAWDQIGRFLNSPPESP